MANHEQKLAYFDTDLVLDVMNTINSSSQHQLESSQFIETDTKQLCTTEKEYLETVEQQRDSYGSSNEDAEQKEVTVSDGLIGADDEAESSGFLYMSKTEESCMLMASGVEGSLPSEVKNDITTSAAKGPPEPKIIIYSYTEVCSNNVTTKRTNPDEASNYVSKSQCTINCGSSDEGNENVDYCEDDEAKLNPEDHNLTLEEHCSEPFIECLPNTETLFNLTTSP